MSKLAVYILTAAALFLSGLPGCSGEPGKLALQQSDSGGPGEFGPWLANGSVNNKSCRPRIEEATIWIDGVRNDQKPKIVVFNSIVGWSESPCFVVPDKATTVRIEAVVTSGGKRYLATKEWDRREDMPASYKRPGGYWKAKSSALTERGPEAGRATN
jgi:hypothetical protein